MAHETASADRVLHYCTGSLAQRAGTVRAALRGWTAGPTGAHAETDPGGDGIAHLPG